MTFERPHNLTRALRAALLTACALAGGAGLAWGDVVYLKTGAALHGEILKQDDATITLRVPYGTVIIEKIHVKSVEKEEALPAMLGEADALIKN